LNKDWWAEKLDRNVARDRQYDGLLAAAGWRVLRFWEHEDPRRMAGSIREAATEAWLRT
jgi:DNA mismatch endonuclease (patch repair protein)